MWYVFLFVIGPMVKGRTPQSVHQQSLWGGGETQWVISLFGRNMLQRWILRTMRTFLKNQIQHSLWDPTSLCLEAIGKTLKDWQAALTRLWHTKKRYKWTQTTIYVSREVPLDCPSSSLGSVSEPRCIRRQRHALTFFLDVLPVLNPMCCRKCRRIYLMAIPSTLWQ